MDAAVRNFAGCRILALDIECASGLHHYGKRVCLMQMAAGEDNYVIDVLADLNLDPVRVLLEDPAVEVVMHDADFDMRSLDRDYGWHPKNIFDTLIAARLSGHRKFGLGSLLEEYFGVKVSKRFQRADWMRRPLTDEMLQYAAADVHHLLELRDVLERKLVKLGRIEWARKRFARREGIRYERDLRPLYARVKGAREALDGRGLAVLKELAEVREQIARERDLPPFKIASDQALVDLARRPPKSPGELKKRRGFHPCLRGAASRSIMKALTTGQRSPRLTWPLSPKRVRRRTVSSDLIDKLKSWRDETARSLDLEPDLILTMDSIKRLASGEALDEVLSDESLAKSGESSLMKSLRKLLSS